MPTLSSNLAAVLIVSAIFLSAPLNAQAKGGGGGHGGGHGGGAPGGAPSKFNAAAAEKETHTASEEHRRYGGGGRGGRRYPYPYNDQDTANQSFSNSLDTYNQSQDAQRKALPTSAFVQEYHWPKTYTNTQLSQSTPNNHDGASAPTQTASTANQNTVDLAVNIAK